MIQTEQGQTGRVEAGVINQHLKANQHPRGVVSFTWKGKIYCTIARIARLMKRNNNKGFYMLHIRRHRRESDATNYNSRPTAAIYI